MTNRSILSITFFLFLSNNDKKFNRPNRNRKLETIIFWFFSLSCKNIFSTQVYALQILLFAENVHLLYVIKIIS